MSTSTQIRLLTKNMKKNSIKKTSSKKQVIDKYKLYQLAVQSPETDTRFLRKIYKQLRGEKGLHFREDFCGTGALSAAWLNLHPDHSAEGFDIDPLPIEWGKVNNFHDVDNAQQRMHWQLKDVCEKSQTPPDVRCAQNFSYCVFKTRDALYQYFKSCYDDLNDKGIFVLDSHGGPESIQDMEEEREIDGHDFTYIWDQDFFSPVTHEAIRKIHFKLANGKMLKNAFVYDWRIWTLPEMLEMLYDIGFEKVICYWEGVDSDGESGNGIFKPTQKGTNDLSWVAYLVALK